MNKEQLANTLMTVEKNTPAVLKIRTEVKMNKKDVATKSEANPYTTIFKIQEVNVLLNPDYQALVNVERLMEGKPADFVADAPTWGTPMGGSVQSHNNQLYVCYVEKGKVGTATYILPDVTPIDYSEFARFIPVRKDSPKQDVENQVDYRKVKLDNVISVTIQEK